MWASEQERKIAVLRRLYRPNLQVESATWRRSAFHLSFQEKLEFGDEIARVVNIVDGLSPSRIPVGRVVQTHQKKRRPP